MTYIARDKVNPGDPGRASDQNQSVDNESALYSGLQPVQFSVSFDGGGAAIVPDNPMAKAGFTWTLPTMTVTGYELGEFSYTTDRTDSDCACQIQIRTCTYANFASTGMAGSDSMIGALGSDSSDAMPGMLESYKAQSATSDITDWANKTIAQGNVVELEIGGYTGIPAFTGSGTNDMKLGKNNLCIETSTTASDLSFRVQIDGTGTPNTFKWYTDGGTNTVATGVSITATNITLQKGVTIKFGATTGHTLNDYWDFSIRPLAGVKKVTLTVKGTRAI